MAQMHDQLETLAIELQPELETISECAKSTAADAQRSARWRFGDACAAVATSCAELNHLLDLLHAQIMLERHDERIRRK